MRRWIDPEIRKWGYLDFLFAEKDDWVFSSDGDGSKTACLDGFEGVFDLEESSFGREYGDEIFVASASFAHCYGVRFEIFLKFISKPIDQCDKSKHVIEQLKFI